MQFLNHLRQRKLGQWTLAYLAAAWLVYDVLSLIGQNFDWPKLVLQVITVLLAIGFLATLVLAWYHGEKGRQRVGGAELLMLAALLVVAATSVSFMTRTPGEPGGKLSTGGTIERADIPEVHEQNSVAVLAFADLSQSRDQGHFSDGIAEEILNDLARIPGLRVAARTSAFAFKDKNVDIREIGSKLGVATVLEGSVRKDGNRLKITVQLINAKDGYHLWSETYERELTSVFAIQEDISQSVARSLEMRLPAAAPAQARATTDIGAYELYLKGRFFMNQRSRDAMHKAIDYFEQAIARDASFALAYAALAHVHAFPLRLGVSAREGADQARAAALKAIALDSTLSEAHAALGTVRSRFEWDWAGAEQEFRLALQLNPNSVAAHSAYGDHLLALGRFDDAIRAKQRARQFDPLSAAEHAGLGMALYLARRYHDAGAALRAALELSPGHSDARNGLISVYVRTGMIEQGIAEAEQFAREDSSPTRALVLARTYVEAGRFKEARRILEERRPDIEAGRAGRIAVALVYAGLGEKDEAFWWLGKGFDERLTWPFAIRQPLLDPLRSDPRFAQLLKKMRLQ